MSRKLMKSIKYSLSLTRAIKIHAFIDMARYFATVNYLSNSVKFFPEFNGSIKTESCL